MIPKPFAKKKCCRYRSENKIHGLERDFFDLQGLILKFPFIGYGSLSINGVRWINLRAREKITSHFSILASARLWPMPHSQNPLNSELFL